ncbi:hypothetical protein FF1_018892 [Malus domestica]
MASANSGRIFACVLWLFFLSLPLSSAVEPSNEHSLVISESDRLQLSRGAPVTNSPGSKPGISVLCERVHIRGLSRLKNIGKFANTVKVKVSGTNSSTRIPTFEVCFHRNTSLGLGMCPQSRWQKVPKGSWSRSMSPFEHQLLDIRTHGSSLESLEVSIEEEFVKYRTTFLILGIIMMSLASLLSNSLVFYYGSGMAIGVVLVILIVLFQGMKLLPTGRKNSLAIFVYSSVVGLGSFLLSYLPGLLRTVLIEIGISEDMYNPLAIFLLAFIFLAGAWLGFWAVHKLVLTEDGSIDIMTSQFVNWSIKILGATLIFQSSVDHLLATEAIVFGFVVSAILKKIFRWRFLRRVCKIMSFQFWSLVMAFQYLPTFPSSISTGKSLKTPKKNRRRLEIPDPPPSPPSPPSDAWLFPSTFHTTPERRKYSKEEWDAFTRDTTTKALQELASSPEYHRWCSSNVERISVAPRSTRKVADQPRHWWLLWLW